MKLTRRILATVLLLAILLTTLAGCNRKQDSAVAPENIVAEQSAQAVQTPAEEPETQPQVQETVPEATEAPQVVEPLAEKTPVESSDIADAPVRQPQNKNEESAIKDDEGNLLVPFDIAYPEEFAAGEFEYEKGHALLKLAAGTDTVSKDLRACGFIGLESFLKTDDGEWYKAKISGVTDVVTAVGKARQLESVLLADFDYIHRTEAEILADVGQNAQVGQQWHLQSSGIQDAWKYLQKNGSQAGGAPSVVVAVIDTGVDYMHPDLKANMWVNTGEIAGDGIDNDGNGYVDDIHGVDTIANTGDPMDDHAHGTHVAGIIAASNNKEGVVGVAYNCKIMAVKAGQATGVFNQSDIAEAITYAHQMGAEVINMSFGGTACSIAVQDALQSAYTQATLVASAGNCGTPNEPTDHYSALPNYPAALSYVIGVMSVGRSGVESIFTNWDATAFNSLEYEVYAPGENILSTLPGGKYGSLSGTSMAAPVVSGAAALLRSYYTDRDKYPSKFISAQLSATSETEAVCCNPEKHTVMGGPHNLAMMLDAYTGLTKLPKPDVTLHNYYLFDSEEIAQGNSGDGVIDAGETVDIGLVLRNRWGMSKDTVVTIDAVNENGMANKYVTFIDDDSNFESVGTYSNKDQLHRENGIIVGTDEPLKIRIDPSCPNDYLIQLNVTVTCGNALDANDKAVYTRSSKDGDFAPIEFWVRNGKVLPSQIKEDTTLTSDNVYIVANSVYIPEGVTVTVEPGTKIQFWTDDPHDPYKDNYIAYLNVAGSFICKGTEADPIQLYPCESMGNFIVEIRRSIGSEVQLQYTTITNAYVHATEVDHCTFLQKDIENRLSARILNNGYIDVLHVSPTLMARETVTNSVFYKVGVGSQGHLFGMGCGADNCAFIDSAIDYGYYSYGISGGASHFKYRYTNCAFVGNSTTLLDGTKAVSSLLVEGLKIDNTETVRTYLDSQNQTWYLAIPFGYGIPSDFVTAVSLAHSLGGEIACIETLEEANMLYNAGMMYTTVGCIQDSNRWLNGMPVESFLSVHSTTYFPNILCRIQDISYGEYYLSEGNGYLLVEIPITNENIDVQWSKEYIMQRYQAMMAQGLNTMLENCAILNNLNDANANNWLRIKAYEGYDPDYSIGMAGNYWGTTDEEMIERQIVDFDDYSTLQDIVVGEYLTEAPEDTFPFVVDAYLLDKDGQRVDVVSNEEVCFVVEFNRDMDTSVPLRVRFGSSEPYAEYEVQGSFESPRVWKGIYTLNTTIENGIQVFNIENGRAASDHYLKLYDSPGRFQFEIDTSAAQALIMQGSATETGINLTWMQDDFDTLIGYNVYRSDKEDGFYQRLNDTVIPADTREFFDGTVEPGMVYYYNFTVVQTDLTESIPSGKTVVQAMDTMAPDIYHSPIRTAYTGSNLVVSATITDNLQVSEATLYYRTAGAAQWSSVAMTNQNSRYVGIIAADVIDQAGLEYYIDAFDGITHTYEGTAETPYLVSVQLAVDAGSMGDINGDSAITILDALMVLQAANDKLNLTREQFLRADLDGNGELSAAEALRILMYANGSITTLRG